MKTRKRFLSLLVCLCMALSLLPATALAADGDVTAIVGGVTLTANGTNGTVAYAKVEGGAVVDATSSADATITFAVVDGTPTLTLSGTISISPSQNVAINLPAESKLMVANGATVNLKGGTGASIGHNAVSCTGNLKVEVGEYATLNAIGGNTTTTYTAGHGIYSSATLTVEVAAGGALNAISGTSDRQSNSGFGLLGSSGLTLSGSGTVRAVSYSDAISSENGSIQITGVSGYALGGINGAFIPSTSQGTLTNAAADTFFIGTGKDGAQFPASLDLSTLTENTYWLDSTSKDLIAHWNYDSNGSTLTVFDLTIPAGQALTIPRETSLTVPDGKTLTNNGDITNSGTLTVDGTLEGAGSITSTGDLTVGGLTVTASNSGSVNYIGDTTNANAGFRLTADGDYAISGEWTGGTLGSSYYTPKAVVTVADTVTAANVTLDGAVIDLTDNSYLNSYLCAFNMTGATVNMTVTGTNTLISRDHRAGIEAPTGSTLTIGGTGTLTAQSSGYGAGIGGYGDYDTNDAPKSGGNITIHGDVTVEATSNQGAGIGGGGSNRAGVNGGDGGTIIIKGSAKVTATSTRGGAGIGGGGSHGDSNTSGSGGTITIEGNAQVTARNIFESVPSGAGIGAGAPGSGTRGSAGTITISGGSVTATSVRFFGVGGNGGSVTVAIDPTSGRQIAVKVGAAQDGSDAEALTDSPFTTETVISDLVINKGKYFHSEQETGEQFTLTPGGTYWFDLSGAGIPGTVNNALPDTDLNWVPFTYAGTINAYVLKADSSGNTTASETASKTSDSNTDVGYTYDHSLFVADYNVTHTVYWADLNTAGFIFGSSTSNYTSGGVDYTLRVPSVGSNRDGGDNTESERGTPHNNEWDAILNKAGQSYITTADTDYIKNWNNIYSWGQDTSSDYTSLRAVRGFSSARFWGYLSQLDRTATGGFRPVLEVLNPVTLTSDGLKAVTLKLNGGRLTTTEGYAGDDVTEMNIVYTGDTFTALLATNFTRPDGNSGDYFKWQDSDGNAYAPGADVPASVTELTAVWTAPAPSGGGTTYYTLTFDTNGGKAISSLHRARGTTIDLSDYTPTREDYVFAGWYADEDLTERVTELRLTRNTTVYAGWNWINPFIDVDEDDWFYEAVRYVYERGLMNGTSSTTFDPDISATRAMLAMITWRMEGSPAPTGANPFTDVAAGEWYTEAIIWCAAEDIMTGYGGGLFGPNDPVTRQQLAALLYRYAQYKGWDVSVGEDTNILSYTDFDQISEWAIPAMQWAVGAGIIQGKTADTLDPRGEATRAEIAMMLMRLLERYDPDFVLPAGAASLPATGLYSTIEPPKTGDSTSSVGFSMLALPVAAGAAYCTRSLRRRKKDDGEPEPEPA